MTKTQFLCHWLDKFLTLKKNTNLNFFWGLYITKKIILKSKVVINVFFEVINSHNSTKILGHFSKFYTCFKHVAKNIYI
jgi:hypothetical protein